MTVVAGRAFGRVSPVATLWPTLYVEVRMPAGTTLACPVEHDERAVYVVEGGVVLDETEVRAGQMAVLEPTPVSLHALGDTRLMLLGGARFRTPRYLFWNFVASSRERIAAAKERWKRQQFPKVPNETEFIPLPLQ